MLYRSPPIPLVFTLALLSCTSTRAPIYTGPLLGDSLRRFLSPDLALAFVAPGRTDGQYITVGCRMSEGVGGCDLYELILTEEMGIRMFTNLSRLNSVRWELFPAVSRSGTEP